MGSKDVSRAKMSELSGDLALDPVAAQKALHYIAGNVATDADDLRELIDILGLNDRPMKSTVKMRAHQAQQKRKARSDGSG